MTHWFRSLEPEIVTTASEQAGKSGAWQKEWDSEPQPHEATSYSSSDLGKDHYHDQDLVKRNHSIAKVTPTLGILINLRMNLLCTTVKHWEGSAGQALYSVSAPRAALPEGRREGGRTWSNPTWGVFACLSRDSVYCSPI